MATLQELKTKLLADGSIDEAEVAELRKVLYADGKIEHDEAELLVSLRNEAKSACPAFEQLFFEAITQCVLGDGSIDAEEAAWLRKALFADGKIDAGEKQFMQQLHTKARSVSPEFQKLFDECMK